MKKLFCLFFLLISLVAQSQNVGIGTSTPVARLHVTDSSVLFSAAGDIGLPGLPPLQGAGRRMMWYPGKAAFRAGYVNGTQWDQNNIGAYSFAAGFGTTASQNYTTAWGFFSNASGVASTALGNQTTAKAFGALSIGSLNDFTDNPDPLNINATDRIFQIGNGFGFFPGNAMTVLRNGNVGIGTTAPLFPLDINGRMRLSGTNPNDPGIWLNDAGVDRAFIGLQNATQVGFYGGNGGVGWGLTMNTITGALSVSGNEGGPGQVLTSNGSAAPAAWSNPATTTKPYGYVITPTQYTSLDGSLLSIDIAGVDNTPFVLNQNSTVIYTLTLRAAAGGTTDSKGYVVVEIVDGSLARVSFASSNYYIKQSTSTTQIASGIALNLAAGSYTIKARLVRLSVGDGSVDTHASLTNYQQGIEFIAQILPN